jgi:HEAT repeats
LENISVAAGLETTFSVLAKTQNEAAARVLLRGIDVSDRDVQIGALRALLARRSAAGQRELVGRWHTLSQRWKNIIAESGDRLSNAIREGLRRADKQLHKNSCDAILDLRDYDMVAALLTAAEDKSSERAKHAAETLLLLADALCEELLAPGDYRNRRHLQEARARMTSALEQSVERFEQHKHREIAEAFLMLAEHSNAVLKHVLQDPHNRAYVTLIHLLSHSQRHGVMRLILDSIDDPLAPSAAYSILARRQDIRFVRHMLMRFAEEVPQTARRNLKRIDSFGWLSDDLSLLAALNGAQQCGAIHLTMASGMSRLAVFHVVDFILTNGKVEGRREAVSCLSDFKGADANAAVVQALDDEDPTVRATAVRQLRDRGIHGAMATLLSLVDCPDAPVREAVRESLGEYTFERFQTAFATMDDETLAETGLFVKRADPNAIASLQAELKSSIRVRRTRALQMAVAMTAVEECEAIIISLLHDDDQVIRATAAESLALSPSATSRKALDKTLDDHCQTVREAAQKTLAFFDSQAAFGPTALGPLPLNLSEFGQGSETGETV